VDSINHVLLGGTAVACLTAALFFLRFWRTTKDRFFIFFAASFLIEGLNRFFFSFLADLREDSPAHYLVRALSYALIVFAILDKNLPGNSKENSTDPMTGKK
jgi:hypothetical protein